MSLSKASVSSRARVPFSLVLLLIVFQAFPFVMFAADASGRFERYCDGAWFYLGNISGLPASHKLLLFFRKPTPSTGLPLKEEGWWTDIYAKRCSPGGKCEDAISARMWLNEGASVAKRISGKYEVDFSAEHLRGQFFVKERKPTQKRVCE